MQLYALIGDRTAALQQYTECEAVLQRELNAVPLLYDETEGNPLFFTGLVRSLVQSGALLQDQEGRWELTTEEIYVTQWPENLRELIGASLRRAPTRAQSLLGPAAVIGRAFELPVLRELLHQSEEKLLDRLDELRKTGLIVEQEGRYRFHHELTRQIVYEGLSMDRRRLWHRKIGDALETLYPQRLDELSGDLVRHFEQAHAWKKAIGYAERAGAQAQNIYAHTEAVKFFTKALELSQKIKDHQGQSQSLNNRGEGNTLENISVLFVSAGKIEEAMDFLEQALEIRRKIEDRRGQGYCLYILGHCSRDHGDPREALKRYQAARTIFEELGLKAEHLLALSAEGVAHLELKELKQALTCSSEAVRLLEGGQTCAIPQEVYFNHHKILLTDSREAAARAYLQKAYDEVLRRAEKITDRETRESFLKNVSINRQILQAWQATQREAKSTQEHTEGPG